MMGHFSTVLAIIINFTLCFFTLGTTNAAIGPVEPVDSVWSKLKNVEKKTQELPYKPRDGETLDAELGPDELPLDASNTSEDAGETVVEKIDWSKIPFVPSKRVELSSAPDPEF